MSRARLEVAVAILAKAPVAGQVKTRLEAALGEGAAALQAKLIERAVETARAADVGPVTLWAAPDTSHPIFDTMARRHGVTLARQPDGDLGHRMLAALGKRPALVIGTDCPALRDDHLRQAAQDLCGNFDAVVIPAEDGGYVLIGTRRSCPALFTGMTWSTETVMAETRARLTRLGIGFCELPPLWDVDRPEDVERMRREGLLEF
jgi:uncharacterized protein